jgi:hypothetical protein
MVAKRLPHGATSDLVLAVLWRLHLQSGRPEPVARADLVGAAALPETTVDNRLRVLLSQGKVLKVARGLYAPVQQKSKLGFDKYSRDHPPLGRAPSTMKASDQCRCEPKPPGTKRVVPFPDDVMLIERWMSTADYIRSELMR